MSVNNQIGFLLLFLTITSINSQETTILKDDSFVAAVTPNVAYIESKEHNLDVFKLQDLYDSANTWINLGTKTPNFGYSNSSYWIRFSILNQSNKPALVLELPYPILDHVTVYFRKKGTWSLFMKTGRMEITTNPDINLRTFAERLTIKKGETYEFLAVFYGSSSLDCEIKIWDPELYQSQKQVEINLFTAYFSILLCMCIYNALLFVSLRDKTYLYYTGYVFFFLVSSGHLYGVFQIFLWYQLPLLGKLMMACTMAAAVFFAALFSAEFLDLKNFQKHLNLILRGLGICALTAVPVVFISGYKSAVQIVIVDILFVCPLLIIAATICLRAGFKPARFYLLAWTFFMITMFVWALARQGIIAPSLLTNHGLQIGSVMEVILLSLALGQRYNAIKEDHVKIEREATESRLRLLESFTKFVPQEFLKLLGKDDLSDLRLGEATERNMTVLFADVRGFTDLSESMTPKENFDFINAILKRIGPVIRQNSGFIDKYIGDGIMALFPKNPDDAINAAIQMKSILGIYNLQRMSKELLPIQIGIGINTGRLMLGTIGEELRMDTTVISDAVNLSSRLESLNKNYGSTILISEQGLFAVQDPTKIDFRIVDQVKVKGRQTPVSVFEIFTGDSESCVNCKREFKSTFEKAVTAACTGDYETAQLLFKEIQEKCPEDKATIYHIGRLDS